MVKRILILFLLVSPLLKAQQDTGHFQGLNMNVSTRNYLMGVRAWFLPLLKSRHVDYYPVQIADSSYILSPQGLTQPEFKEVVDSVRNTPYKDSIYLKILPDSLIIHSNSQ